MDCRAPAHRLIDAVVPSDFGDEKFATIINGRNSPGYGTTCAYLPALLLWSLGCRQNALVNYDDPGGLTTTSSTARSWCRQVDGDGRERDGCERDAG
jgi:hypothetical protein